jgi:molybdopterin converting factor small subunit
MAIVVHLPGVLAPLARGQSRVVLDPCADVAAALRALYALHPALRDRIQDEQGVLRPHVNVFVGSDNVRDTGGLATAVPPDAEVYVLPAVSGG